MLFHLLKFMVAECGCNRAHSALKGDIFVEAHSFPSSLCVCSVAAGPEHFPVITRAPEEKGKQNGFQV